MKCLFVRDIILMFFVERGTLVVATRPITIEILDYTGPFTRLNRKICFLLVDKMHYS